MTNVKQINLTIKLKKSGEIHLALMKRISCLVLFSQNENQNLACHDDALKYVIYKISLLFKSGIRIKSGCFQI